MQKCFVFVMAILIILLFSRDSSAEDGIQSLIGSWKITVFQDDGRDRLERLGVKPVKKGQKPRFAKMIFTKTECLILRGDGKREKASGLANAGWKSCKLNATTSPKSIDIEGFTGKNNEKTKTYKGIYKLEGKTLTICYCEQGNKRPSNFESDGANNLFVCEKLSDVLEKLKSGAASTSK